MTRVTVTRHPYCLPVATACPCTGKNVAVALGRIAPVPVLATVLVMLGNLDVDVMSPVWRKIVSVVVTRSVCVTVTLLTTEITMISVVTCAAA